MNHKQLMEILRTAAENLATEIEKSFPTLKQLTYSEDSLASSKGPNFINRMVFGIYMELLRAELLNDIESPRKSE